MFREAAVLKLYCFISRFYQKTPREQKSVTIGLSLVSHERRKK
jgi:hypothetical protein